MTEPLRFGTYVEFQCPPGHDHAELIGDVLALAVHSDKTGFHVFTRINGEWKLTHTALTQQILCNYQEGWGKTRVSLDEDWLKPVDDLKQNLGE